MANFRIPGPLCGTRDPWSIDDGTLPRCSMPHPGSICASSDNYPTPVSWQQRRPPHAIDLEFLFRECRNPQRGLSAADYAAAADQLKVDVAVIQAIAEVETSGHAFDESGRPRILFERHYFHRYTAAKYDAKHPGISSAKQGGYGKFSAQYAKLEEAYRLAPEAALRSASWGRFQIMGGNFKAAGFTSVEAFVLAMSQSESEHLKAFTHFVMSNKAMLSALRKHDWARFAKAYNGPGYLKNEYDTKLRDAHRRYVALAAKNTAGSKLP